MFKEWIKHDANRIGMPELLQWQNSSFGGYGEKAGKELRSD